MVVFCEENIFYPLPQKDAVSVSEQRNAIPAHFSQKMTELGNGLAIGIQLVGWRGGRR